MPNVPRPVAFVQTNDSAESDDALKAPDTLFAFERPEDLEELKEMKVSLPIALHLKLHTLKVTRGVAISEVVAAALAEFLARLEDD